MPPSTVADFITVVSGLPRSGTSMMMRMLEAGGMPVLTDGVRAADDDNPNGYYEFEPVKHTRTVASWVPHAVGKAVKMVHMLLYDLPATHRYRVLFMRREPAEIVASQAAMLERAGRRGGGLKPDLLVATYNQQIDSVLHWMHAQPNFSVMEVSYNRLLRDSRPIIDEVCTFLAALLDRAAMGDVINPALYRQRAAPATRSDHTDG